eukprot:CAMPEP_0113648602 /NCGR_PEP_ID=MMETSP0017_2-20120614/25788_1 /TAXON_ID=2856 /ORGANISM="Cylindrotheca closterium" /LENGTH=62 /DNA_ID=CAMNT_0000560849 /DNA_START=201 /DNA_END=386 /DNA_ORIENTATION=+ /assembly_acc=CAM_ASM_000147
MLKARVPSSLAKSYQFVDSFGSGFCLPHSSKKNAIEEIDRVSRRIRAAITGQPPILETATAW